MGVRAPEEAPLEIPAPPLLPPLRSALLCVLLVLVAFNLNGRPIGSADARPTERVAASLVSEGNFDLDEFADVEEPFARTVDGHRVSIYPVASAVLAAPVFAVASRVVALDETALALAGKVAACLFSAVAAGVLFLALGLRGRGGATRAALLFALATSVWSTSQALWQHPAAVLGLTLTLLCMVRAEHDPVWAGRAGLPLAFVVAARHADVALAAVLAIAIVARWPRRAGWFALWALPVAVLLAAYQWTVLGSPLRQGFPGVLGRFSAPWGEGHLGLLVSPGKGLFVFTPVALVAAAGLGRAWRQGERWLAGSLAAAALAHWVLIGRWSEWHGGECWGPRMMTDALPLLFLFLPEGLAVLPTAGLLLAAFSVAVQVLGAFAYDYTWERLRQRPPASTHPELWDVAKSPIVFYLERRLVILALPAIEDGRLFVREHPVVLGGGRRGSRARFGDGDVVVEGAESTMADVHLERGARVVEGRARLRARWDGVFLRVTDEARPRKLELRIDGTGRGTVYVGERTFWSASPRWTAYPVGGRFRIRHPYEFARSGGGDLTVTIGKSPGEVDLESIALVPPSEPENVIRR